MLVAGKPAIDLFFDIFLFLPVAFLQNAGKAVPFSLDLREVGIGEIAPRFLDPAFHLRPVAFYLVPVHLPLSCIDTLLRSMRPARQINCADASWFRSAPQSSKKGAPCGSPWCSAGLAY